MFLGKHKRDSFGLYNACYVYYKASILGAGHR
jgi:hypothetical protein